MDFFSGLYRFRWKKTGQLASAALEPPIASRAPKKGLPLFPWKAPCPRMVEPHCQGGSPRRTCHWLLHCNTFQECICTHSSGGGSATWWYLGGVPACSSRNHWICPACAWCASIKAEWAVRVKGDEIDGASQVLPLHQFEDFSAVGNYPGTIISKTKPSATTREKFLINFFAMFWKGCFKVCTKVTPRVWRRSSRCLRLAPPSSSSSPLPILSAAYPLLAAAPLAPVFDAWVDAAAAELATCSTSQLNIFSAISGHINLVGPLPQDRPGLLNHLCNHWGRKCLLCDHWRNNRSPPEWWLA